MLSTLHIFFFFNDTATTEIYTLSLHDALPISFLPPAPGSRRHGRALSRPPPRLPPAFPERIRESFPASRTAIHRSLARPAAAGSCPPWMPCRRAGPNRDRFWCRIQLPRLPNCIRPRTPIIFGKASARQRSEGRSSSRLLPEESVALSAGLV